MKSPITRLTLLLAFLFIAEASYAEDVALEDYASLPLVRSFAMSPNGEHVAYIRRSGKGDYLIVGDLDSGYRLGGANSESINARSVQFLNDTQILLRGGDIVQLRNAGRAWNDSAAIIYDLETRKLRVLPKGPERYNSGTVKFGKTVGFNPEKKGFGKIVGFNEKKNLLLMPALTNRPRLAFSLAYINIEKNSVQYLDDGLRYTTDWFSNSNGDVIAQEQFHQPTQSLQVFAGDSSEWRLIHEESKKNTGVLIEAVSADSRKLIFTREVENEDGVYTMSLEDGSIEGPFHVEKDTEIKRIITAGLNRQFAGVEYSGLMDSSVYFDPVVRSQFRAVSEFFPESSIQRIASATDSSQSIYFVSGNAAANSYYVLHAATMNLTLLGQDYPNISDEHIGEIKAVKYKARDGFSINAVVTWPVGLKKRENLPLVVLPHSLPESYSSVSFDWLAQYFARLGYVVLQPNYRGSGGFGGEYTEAGRGQWGKLMQDDITDGVSALVEGGHVDASRVCIVGSSFGGYTALAGAAFTPELYRCAVAIGGIFDVPRMLGDVHPEEVNHWFSKQWPNLITSSRPERQKLAEISPVLHADDVQAPVLLLHDKEDAVIPISQSRAMFRALKKYGKSVRLVTLKGESDWRTSNITRVQLLQEISTFLKTHNPPNEATN